MKFGQLQSRIRELEAQAADAAALRQERDDVVAKAEELRASADGMMGQMIALRAQRDAARDEMHEVRKLAAAEMHEALPAYIEPPSDVEVVRDVVDSLRCSRAEIKRGYEILTERVPELDSLEAVARAALERLGEAEQRALQLKLTLRGHQRQHEQWVWMRAYGAALQGLLAQSAHPLYAPTVDVEECSKLAAAFADEAVARERARFDQEKTPPPAQTSQEAQTAGREPLAEVSPCAE